MDIVRFDKLPTNLKASSLYSETYLSKFVSVKRQNAQSVNPLVGTRYPSLITVIQELCWPLPQGQFQARAKPIATTRFEPYRANEKLKGYHLVAVFEIFCRQP